MPALGGGGAQMPVDHENLTLKDLKKMREEEQRGAAADKKG